METPVSQFDFNSYYEQGIENPTFPPDQMLYGFGDAQATPTFLTDELFRDVPYSSWVSPTVYEFSRPRNVSDLVQGGLDVDIPPMEHGFSHNFSA